MSQTPENCDSFELSTTLNELIYQRILASRL